MFKVYSLGFRGLGLRFNLAAEDSPYKDPCPFCKSQVVRTFEISTVAVTVKSLNKHLKGSRTNSDSEKSPPARPKGPSTQ